MRKYTLLATAFFAAACGDDETQQNADAGTLNPDAGMTSQTILPANIDCNTSLNPPLCRFPGGDYTTDMTFGPDRQFLLEGNVFIGGANQSATLTILPGTTVFGADSSGQSKAALIIRPGSKIIADGTKDRPIVFTSAKPDGSRRRGDWGGLIINGNAPVNCGGGAPTCQGEGNSGAYGGDNASDNSGILRYVRVEFAGARITDEDEYNGIAFQGVGSGTLVDYVHLHQPSDDGIEFFGGTVNAKHILVTGAGDDCLDWTFGWRGKLQFFVSQQAADEANSGIEADNNDDDNAAQPRSSPTLANLTLVGEPAAPENQIGAVFRRGTEVKLWNSIIYNFDRCLDIDSDETFNNIMANPGNFVLRNNIIDCSGQGQTVFVQEMEETFNLETFVTMTQMGNMVGSAGMPGNATNKLTPDFKPTSGPAMSGAATIDDTFLTSTSYRGGVDPANDWTLGWTAYPAN